MKRQPLSLENISTPELLKLRLCDLRLTISQSPIQLQIGQLYAELAQRQIKFRPHVWISTSWFSPYGIPGFALPFYLLHPRLRELEHKYIGEVEGGSEEWCMKLLRHETGHAIDNAFLLRRNKARQRLFGLSGTPYPRQYSPNPHSTDFVIHLENHYAQAHPDEDWAETFALWLDPQSNWRADYRNWGAIRKLELVNSMLEGILGKRQVVQNRETFEELGQCRQTLREYFAEKQHKFAGTIKRRHNIDCKEKLTWIPM